MEQMKEVLELLSRKDLNRAVDEQKQVLAKLEELKRLLLATENDLQMMLERLRQLQNALKKLDEAITEEKRERDQSSALADQQLNKRPTDEKKFDGLKQDQERNRKLTDAIAQMAKELGSYGAKAVSPLGDALASMSKAEGSLGGQKAGDAKGQQEEAIASLGEARGTGAGAAEAVAGVAQRAVRSPLPVYPNIVGEYARRRRSTGTSAPRSPSV